MENRQKILKWLGLPRIRRVLVKISSKKVVRFFHFIRVISLGNERGKVRYENQNRIFILAALVHKLTRRCIKFGRANFEVEKIPTLTRTTSVPVRFFFDAKPNNGVLNRSSMAQDPSYRVQIKILLVFGTVLIRTYLTN